uniref:30S ribosome-binding factor RbfA n=1 Tax=Ndongobacter massiliensis TaxID=1871025 RepID=UPI00093097F9|nr:30S ribosome-binding factor RbfA [Ndongobacter massiliensis]
MDQKRVRRISQEIKKSLSHAISFELNDPKIAAITSLTEVRVSSDLAYADVYVTILGTPWEKRQTLEGLENAAGFLKRRLGEDVKLRSMPELRFHGDESIEHGLYMDKLIEKTLEEDRKAARARGEEVRVDGEAQDGVE